MIEKRSMVCFCLEHVARQLPHARPLSIGRDLFVDVVVDGDGDVNENSDSSPSPFTSNVNDHVNEAPREREEGAAT